MPVVTTCAHDWVRDQTNKGPTNVTLACRLCGAASVSRGKVRGRSVTTSIDLYPPRGSAMLDPQLYEFFIRQWEAECTSLAQTGFTVNMRSPIVHTQARSGAGGGRQPRRSRGVTGRDVMLAVAVVLLGGIAMLSAGISLDIGWLKIAGAASLVVLFLLLLLVLHLSN
ncbi:MAG TPA: hypothetical protein VH561_04685 [Micromonosporaceae bacterium]|jgi:hypothetical protein